MDKLKKSGMDMDMNIEQMDWVEDNKKVSHFIFTSILCDWILSSPQMSRNTCWNKTRGSHLLLVVY